MVKIIRKFSRSIAKRPRISVAFEESRDVAKLDVRERHLLMKPALVRLSFGAEERSNVFFD